MAEIMDISKKGALKTQIMYKANLSFAQLTEYLNRLEKNSLLEKTSHNGKEIYKSTQKGIDFLERQRGIMDLLCQEETTRNGVRIPPLNLLGRI